MTRLHFVVRGRVQGIGYRWFVVEKAQALGLSGWVRNNPDGTVEAEAEGSERALERFAQMLRGGHPYAAVEGLQTRELKAKGEKDGFDIR